METRTSYVLVGVFLLAAAAGLIGFIIWSVKSDTATQYTIYRTYFTGSVSGLNEASDVRYRGIPIGQVTDIRIDPDNVERIRVTMRIVATTPIKEDSVASVEMQGITGVSYIQVSGGSHEAPALKPKGDQKYPVITAQRSQLEALFADAPELINRVIKLTDEVAKILNDENRTAISETLSNVRAMSENLSASSGQIAALIDDMGALAADLRVAAKDIRGGFARIETGALDLMSNADGEITGIGGEARKMLSELSVASEELHGMIAENRKPIRDFSGDGLYDLSRMIVEMRGLVSSLTRIAHQLETDPSLYLFGGSEKGFEAK